MMLHTGSAHTFLVSLGTSLGLFLKPKSAKTRVWICEVVSWADAFAVPVFFWFDKAAFWG
jgi:hypothetical protein